MIAAQQRRQFIEGRLQLLVGDRAGDVLGQNARDLAMSLVEIIGPDDAAGDEQQAGDDGGAANKDFKPGGNDCASSHDRVGSAKTKGENIISQGEEK